MQVSIRLLIVSSSTLLFYMLIGVIMRKTHVVNQNFAKAMSKLLFYCAQIAMYIHGYIAPFDKNVFAGVCKVCALSFVAHALFFGLAFLVFKGNKSKQKNILMFASVFANSGYIGVPLISNVFGDDFIIYATVYLIGFNIFCFSLGRMVFTGDKKYISVKNMFINPSVLPIMIGVVIYLTGIGGWISEVTAKDAAGMLIRNDFVGNLFTVIYNVITSLKNIVGPACMLMVGVRLADLKLSGMFKDKNMYQFLFSRHFLFPFAMWLLMIPMYKFGLIDFPVMAVILILTSTPAASITSIFAELYDSDAEYAGKLVAVSTVLSIITIPIVALLLNINI